ncbi:MAG: methylated-DNA--[protein]-cysteine S-methyltransferase [Firmicutes bacterium]|nr:methylated-DNA--[protein]-cysteine S-methyltransferase [Bacillota bacterium]
MQQSIYKSPLGPFFLWFYQDQLVYATFREEEGQKHLSKHFPKISCELAPLSENLVLDLDRYFRGEKLEFDWPLNLAGTGFQKRVWDEIAKIPHGSFTTYKKIGDSLRTKAYRAIGQAVGANPASVIVPCHRVLGTNSLGGYSGGLNLKRLLLELENVTLVPNLRA